MPNLERVTGKIFAENASPVGNNPEIGKFGNAKQGIFTGEANISEIQNSEAWSQGWTGAIVSSNNYPPLPEMNGVLKNLSQQICYLLQKGVPEWDSGTTYYTNDYVNYKGTLYFSTIDNNTTEPLTPEAGNNWKSGQVTLPIATTSSIGAVQPDGESIGITSEGVISILQNPIIDISHPIGDPIITLNNTLNDNEIWLEGASVSSNTYNNLFDIYGYNYTPIRTLYTLNGTLNGNLTLGNNNFVVSPQAITDYVTTNLTLSNNTSDFSIEVPIKIKSYHNNPIVNFNKLNKMGILLFLNNSNKLILDISGTGYNWNVGENITSPQALDLYTWYMIKLTYTAETKTYKVYYAPINYYTPAEYGKQVLIDNLEYTEAITHTASLDFYYEEDMTWNFGSTAPGEQTANFYFIGDIDLGGVIPSVLTSQKVDNFNIPDCRERGFWGTDETGNFGYVPAGLPNITGRLGTPQLVGSGVFIQRGVGRNLNASGVNSVNRLDFNANVASSIYGSSDTVRPPSVKVRVKTRYQ